MPNKTRPELVGATEAAARLWVTERWVCRATQQRRIPSYRVGGYRRYDLADLAAEGSLGSIGSSVSALHRVGKV